MVERRPPDPHPAIDIQDHSAWLDPIRNQLDESARDLDAPTLSRLNRARQQALAELGRSTPRRWPWLALAGAASLALALIWLPELRAPTPESMPVADTSVEDFQLLTSEENLALYSDLDFYAWLDTQDLGS